MAVAGDRSATAIPPIAGHLEWKAASVAALYERLASLSPSLSYRPVKPYKSS
jgi:hypothetical protein